jgi:hypothetical protein
MHIYIYSYNHIYIYIYKHIYIYIYTQYIHLTQNETHNMFTSLLRITHLGMFTSLLRITHVGIHSHTLGYPNKCECILMCWGYIYISIYIYIYIYTCVGMHSHILGYPRIYGCRLPQTAGPNHDTHKFANISPKLHIPTYKHNVLGVIRNLQIAKLIQTIVPAPLEPIRRQS